MGGGLIAVDQRASDGGPVLELGEGGEAGEVLLHSQPDVGLVLGESDVDESGNLYITSKRVIWHSTHTPHGIAVSLVDLSMHAISRDLEAYPKPCIYTQPLYYTHKPQTPAGDGKDEEEGENKCVLSRLIQPPSIQFLLIIPLVLQVDTVDAIFKALCDSAALNPDPEGAEQEGEGDWYYNEDEVLSNARVLLPEGDPDEERAEKAPYFPVTMTPILPCHPISRQVLPEGDPDQFEDADEDEEEEDEGAGAAAGS
ncbi:unnamed protein product [Closterium sp. NIES-65]|nr:unnamed protein product [Closterium sp. NIES-65]